MLRKTIVIGLLLVVAFMAGRWVVDLTRSEADRAWLVLQRMAQGFDEGSPSDAAAGFADDYRDPDSSFGKREIVGGLIHLKQEYGGTTYPWTIELDRAASRIEVEGEKALIRGPAVFRGRSSGEAVWIVDFTAQLEPRSGEWRVVSIEVETQNGRRPF